MPIVGLAQIRAVGVAAGAHIASSTMVTFETNSYIIEYSNIGTGGRFSPGTDAYLNFGAFLEHHVFKKYNLSHSIILHQYYPSYFIINTTNNRSVNETLGLFAISYTGLLQLFNKGGLRFLVGLGMDVNFTSYSPPTFNDADLNELVTELQNTFNPLVYYIGGELGYRAGRIDLAIKYNHSLNSLTNSLAYQGNNYAIPTRQAFLFLNIGFLVFKQR